MHIKHLASAILIGLSWTVTGCVTQTSPIVVGLQMHSLRAQMPQNFTGTLDKVQQWGITDLELGSMANHTPEQYKQELDKRHLHATGIHSPWDRFTKDFDGVINDAKLFGADYVTIAWIPHKGAFTADDARHAAQKFNEWGKKCADAGLHFTYHPHGYEFDKYENGTVFDVLVASTNPQYVNFELDVFWAYVGGADPVKLMQKYPTRFPQLHLKDMDKSVTSPATLGKKAHEANVPLGTGQIDIAGILREGKKIGVKHYYIEDESDRSEKQIPLSAAFMRTAK